VSSILAAFASAFSFLAGALLALGSGSAAKASQSVARRQQQRKDSPAARVGVASTGHCGTDWRFSPMG